MYITKSLIFVEVLEETYAILFQVVISPVSGSRLQAGSTVTWSLGC